VHHRGYTEFVWGVTARVFGGEVTWSAYVNGELDCGVGMLRAQDDSQQFHFNPLTFLLTRAHHKHPRSKHTLVASISHMPFLKRWKKKKERFDSHVLGICLCHAKWTSSAIRLSPFLCFTQQLQTKWFHVWCLVCNENYS